MEDHEKWTALDKAGTVLLDSSNPGDDQCMLFCSPIEVLQTSSLLGVESTFLAVDRAILDGYYVAGYVAYEAGLAYQNLELRGRADHPLIWFGVYTDIIRLSQDDVAWGLARRSVRDIVINELLFDFDWPTYRSKVETIRDLIREGDVYQINLTGPNNFQFEGSPLVLYAQLRSRQRVRYGAFINTGMRQVLSFSPECFFQRYGGVISTRPMKGTVRRGDSKEEDARLKEWLANDEKNRAENLMIVDLLRNDLSMLCEIGSVKVPKMYTVETYETLFQMTSTVTGQLKAGKGYSDIFRALFPCGSITGAPKRRAMQRIAALEKSPRGVYCGAIGYLAPGEKAEFSVAIRTIQLTGDTGVMGTGGGIVWDSDPRDEYEECRLKARFLQQTENREEFYLIETMCWDGGEIPFFPLHQARLMASANYFQIRFNPELFNATIRRATKSLIAGTQHRVRALLSNDGTCNVTVSAIGEEDLDGRILLSTKQVNSKNRFLYHKTSRRGQFEQAYEAARSQGYDDVIFCNERGEITEGSRNNIFISDGDKYITPPLCCGLLPGVMRQHMIESLNNVEEEVIYPLELLHADVVYICNAVRGKRRVSVHAHTEASV